MATEFKKTPTGLTLMTDGADFTEAAAITFSPDFEGGEVNDPKDPGGHTKFGISQRAYPNEDISALTLERAQFIAKRDYWYQMRLDVLNSQSIANNLFDFAFHHGVRGVSKKFQFVMARYFGFKGLIDGIIGSTTIGYANSLIVNSPGSGFALHQSLIKARIDYYLTTAPDIYLKGFVKRASYFL